MENIPKNWLDPKKANLKDPNKRFTDLTVPDMPVAASIVVYGSPTSPQDTVVSYKEVREGDAYKRVQNSGVVVKYIGGQKVVQNRRLLELIMGNSTWNKYYGPDPKDPTGFWTQLGVISPRTIQVVVPDEVKTVTFADLNLSKVKAAGSTTPLMTVDKQDMPEPIGDEASGE